MVLKMDELEKKIDDILEGTSNISQAKDDIDEEFLNDFIAETKEHIEAIEEALLKLEKKNEQKEEINCLFREFHTIKGISGFVDQPLIQKLAHETETILDYFRKNDEVLTNEIIEAVFRSSDYIKQICNDLTVVENEGYSDNVFVHIDYLKKLGDTKRNNYSIKKEQVNVSNESTEISNIEKTKETDINKYSSGYENSSNGNEKKDLDNGLIRIPIGKVDAIVDMVGELIINQALVEQETAQHFGNNMKLSILLYTFYSKNSELVKSHCVFRFLSLRQESSHHRLALY